MILYLHRLPFTAENNEKGVDVFMAKAGMRRPDPKDPHGTESNRKGYFPKNDTEPVPEIQGKAKQSNKRANPV